MNKKIALLCTGLMMSALGVACGKSGSSTPATTGQNQYGINPVTGQPYTTNPTGVYGSTGCVQGQTGFTIGGRCVPGANLAQACAAAGGAIQTNNSCRVTGPAVIAHLNKPIGGRFSQFFCNNVIAGPNDTLSITGDLYLPNSKKSWDAQVYVGNTPVSGAVVTSGSGGSDVPFHPAYSGVVCLKITANGRFKSTLEVRMTRCEDGAGNTYPCN